MQNRKSGLGYHRFKVVKEFEVSKAKIARAFGQDGGGIQFDFQKTKRDGLGNIIEANGDWVTEKRLIDVNGVLEPYSIESLKRGGYIIEL